MSRLGYSFPKFQSAFTAKISDPKYVETIPSVRENVFSRGLTPFFPSFNVIKSTKEKEKCCVKQKCPRGRGKDWENNTLRPNCWYLPWSSTKLLASLKNSEFDRIQTLLVSRREAIRTTAYYTPTSNANSYAVLPGMRILRSFQRICNIIGRNVVYSSKLQPSGGLNCVDRVWILEPRVVLTFI